MDLRDLLIVFTRKTGKIIVFVAKPFLYYLHTIFKNTRTDLLISLHHSNTQLAIKR